MTEPNSNPYAGLSLHERVVIVLTRWATTLNIVDRLDFPGQNPPAGFLCEAFVTCMGSIGVAVWLDDVTPADADPARSRKYLLSAGTGRWVSVSLNGNASTVEILDALCYCFRTLSLRKRADEGHTSDVLQALAQDRTPFVLPGGLDYFPTKEAILKAEREVQEVQEVQKLPKNASVALASAKKNEQPAKTPRTRK